MNSRRLIAFPEAQDEASYWLKPAHWKGANVRFGSKADIAVQNGMSALHPKADMCSALGDVRFVPIADMASLIRSPHLQRSADQMERRGPTFWRS